MLYIKNIYKAGTFKLEYFSLSILQTISYNKYYIAAILNNKFEFMIDVMKYYCEISKERMLSYDIF